MTRNRMRAAVMAAAIVVAAATSAVAQDYTATIGTAAQYLEQRPAGATLLNVTSAASGPATTAVSLPFEFPFYGRVFSNAVVSAHGMLVVGKSGAIPNTANPFAAHGQQSSAANFPYSSSGDVDGLVATHWAPLLLVNDGTAGSGAVYAWTVGAAPNRRFVISWDNVQIDPVVLTRVTMQCHLYETSGKIVFSYSGPWGSVPSWICGIDSVTSLSEYRWTVPPGVFNDSNNHFYSGADIVFDPRTVTFTGVLRYDRIVSDETGIGNATQFNQPLAGVRVEIRRDVGIVANAATTAADGSFTLSAVGVSQSSAGSLDVLAQNAGCRVATTTSGATHFWSAVPLANFTTGANVGTLTLGAGADPTAALRADLNVAAACGAAYAFAKTATTDAIARLDVLVDPAATSPTDYQKAGASPAVMHVGSAASGNSDVWDDAMIVKAYARHVLASIAAPPATAYDSRFDAATDAQNAFAEGFGFYVWAAVSGSSKAIDGRNATTAVVYDLEHPTIVSPAGPDVAGRVAAALFDLVDPANEEFDPIDGVGAADRALRAADALTATPTAATFVQAWFDAGYDALGLSSVFVGDGVFADDAFEANDASAQAAALGAAGFAPRTLVLNRFNEDWFLVTLPADAAGLSADAKYDKGSTNAVVDVEIRDTGGAVIATGAFIGATSATHASTGAVPAGTYKVRVRHRSGGALASYVFQAYVPPTMDASPIKDWTVGRPYDLALGVKDGIAPYSITTPTGAPPTGIGLNSVTLRAAGVPTTVGQFLVAVQLKDGGDPANLVVRNETVAIHDVFKFPIAPFVAFPAGRTIDATLPTHEGTPPFTLSMSSGALTDGLAFAPGTLHVTGTATPGPSSAFELDGVDVAGSADHVATRAVVAVQLAGKKTPAELAAGTDACGWWFDAVAGSTVTFSVATAKGGAKRPLTGMLLAPDRSQVVTGKVKGAKGSVSGSKLVCPISGRYCFVASATDAGAATQLLGTLTVALPKSGKATFKTFAHTATTTISFGAVPGSTAVVKFAGEKKTTLVGKVVSITDPLGRPVSHAGLVKPSALGGTLTIPLDVGGTWSVVLGADSTTGVPGKLTWSYVLTQKKGAAYSAG